MVGNLVFDNPNLQLRDETSVKSLYFLHFLVGQYCIVIYKEEALPEYIPQGLDILQLKDGGPLPQQPEYQTIYISGGKKNKVNKGDIVGFFLQKGRLDMSDLGLIEVKDFVSFAAVRASMVKTLLNNIRNQKLKGKKYKIEVARQVTI